MKEILVAHDGSDSSGLALKKALEIAGKFNSSLTVISVVPELYLTELMEVDRARILESLMAEAKKTMEEIKKTVSPLRLKTVIKRGNPADEILQTAQSLKADLVVTGSHGRRGAQKFLLGSVSSKIVEHAECSVLVVKNPLARKK
jgi:nucleotide-binding universal stress UspA family protein